MMSLKPGTTDVSRIILAVVLLGALLSWAATSRAQEEATETKSASQEAGRDWRVLQGTSARWLAGGTALTLAGMACFSGGMGLATTYVSGEDCGDCGTWGTEGLTLGSGVALGVLGGSMLAAGIAFLTHGHGIAKRARQLQYETCLQAGDCSTFWRKYYVAGKKRITAGGVLTAIGLPLAAVGVVLAVVLDPVLSLVAVSGGLPLSIGIALVAAGHSMKKKARGEGSVSKWSAPTVSVTPTLHGNGAMLSMSWSFF